MWCRCKKCFLNRFSNPPIWQRFVVFSFHEFFCLVSVSVNVVGESLSVVLLFLCVKMRKELDRREKAIDAV